MNSTTPAPSIRAVVFSGWIVIAIQVVAAVSAVRTHEYVWAVAACVNVFLLLAAQRFLQRAEQWGDQKLREAEAKAALSELLLAKVRDGEEFNLRLAIPLADHGGTKH